MEPSGWLNYQHLHYFWIAAREGSVTGAARRLHRSQPTVSAQVRALEDAIGTRLFERVGRRVELTEAGRIALDYAEEIFGLGRELGATLAGRPTGRPIRLAVGIADTLPKRLVASLLEPAIRGERNVCLIAREGRPELLVADLARHELDLVLADALPQPVPGRRVTAHALGRSPIIFMGPRRVAARLKGRFPRSLDGAPILLPGPASGLRRTLEAWFAERNLHPRITAECDDSALLKELGTSGGGLFPVPAAIAAPLARERGLRVIGEAEGVTESYVAITQARRIEHPAVRDLLACARRLLA